MEAPPGFFHPYYNGSVPAVRIHYVGSSVKISAVHWFTSHTAASYYAFEKGT